MSKRVSSGQSNTLLNYFQSPKANKVSKKQPEQQKKPDKKAEYNEDSEDIIIKKRKRIRVLGDSDSDTENCESPKPSVKKAKPQSGIDKLNQYSFGKSTEEDSLPVSHKKPKKACSDEDDAGLRWLHEKLPFLQKDKIRDANKNKPNHSDYDPNTLYVPKDYLDTLTPAMRQWWILKSRNYQTVLFFKVGKFYELYHMDAVVGVEKLGFSYMKGDFAHSGFPESAYGRFAQSLIEQGYSVSRVEQTETPEMMADRCKKIKATKFDKVVNREICQISTKGSCLYTAQMPDARQSTSTYMMAICEKKSESKRFGVCFLDVSIGVFYVGEFDDDKHLSRVLTMISQYYPSLLLLERGHMDSETLEILKTQCSDVKIESLQPNKEFLSAEKVLEILKSECYFKDDKGNFQWPKKIDEILEDGMTYKSSFENGLRSFGACISYLKKCLIDVQVLQMKKFELYEPVDVSGKVVQSEFMTLDSTTLENLKILGATGTLQKTIDYCVTPFGKRLLHHWLCKPLCNLAHIERRQGAIKELLNNKQLLKNTRELLAKMPDLDRQIVKIHTFGNAHCSKNHPDSRAILYEAKTYNKRKIADLMSTLDAFEALLKIPEMYKKCESTFLRKLTQNPPVGNFIDLKEHLKFFKGAFDQRQAKEEGTIIPERGVDDEYDSVLDEIASIEQSLEGYLQEQSKFFKCEVKYFGNDKKRYQLEIPESKTGKVSSEYQLESTRKGSKPCKRYSTSVTKEFLAQMMKAEAEKARIIQDLNRKIFEKFSDRYDDWIKVVKMMSILDCVCSLAEYASLCSDEICLPKLLPFAEKPFCRIENGKHASITMSDFVPNDVELGTQNQAALMILTGPNMGGKSTLMRQVALISILSQIGSFVPASYCEMTLVDRIFTRMGARDEIIKGQSTFLVELSEAAAILQHATKHSLVLIDELGRGTSTHDGNAIATAYVQKLTKLSCRIIFSTHYHTLVEHFSDTNIVQLGYMVCMVETNEESGKKEVTFLYKLAHGVCPKSYGFHVASLAGLSTEIIDEAEMIATKLETAAKNRRLLQLCAC